MPLDSRSSRPQVDADVVIATYCRPTHMDICLQHIRDQTVVPRHIVVVDASPDDLTRHVVARHAGVTYLRNGAGPGHTSGSRRIGMDAGTGSIVAFIDDDAYADPGWLAALCDRHDSTRVGVVGGRVIDEGVEPASCPSDQIGRLLPNGVLTGNFSCDPGDDVDVDHVLGASFSLRRAAVEEVGGIRDIYPGTCLREESDIQLRLRLAGFRTVFTPESVVNHMAGPYHRGRRFDSRYAYYAERNHIVLLAQVAGIRSRILRNYLRTAGSSIVGELANSVVESRTSGPAATTRRPIGALRRGAVRTLGLAAGGLAAVRLRAARS